MLHPDEGTIHSWLDGALSPDEAAQVEAHVKDCAQCQAAVAEARGFIAASSRILTALDNAPRGVIPAAKPVKRIDPMMWRIAATVLVVAAGTLLVVRNNGIGERSTLKATAADSASRVQATGEKPEAVVTGTTATAPTATIQSAPVLSQENSAAMRQPPVLARGGVKQQRDNVAASEDSRTDQQTSKSKAAAFGAIAGRAPAPSNMNAGQVAAGAPITAQARRFEEPLRVGGMNSMADAAAEEPKLREIGPGRRALGEKRTLYEVAPGDTVMLAEQVLMQLQSVVVSGAGAAQAPAVSGAPAPQERSRAMAKTAAPAETPRPAAAPPPAAVPVTPSFIEGADGVNTLTWKDSASGNVVKLSGHHTRAELEAIRRKIDQMRAAAAARDSVKKD